MKLKFLAYETYCYENADVIDVEPKDIIDTIEVDNFKSDLINSNGIERLLPKCEDTKLYDYYVYVQLLYKNDKEFIIHPSLKLRYLFLHPSFYLGLRKAKKIFFYETFWCEEIKFYTRIKYKLTVYKRRKFFSLQENAFRSIVSNGMNSYFINLVGKRVFSLVCGEFYDFYRPYV